MLTETVTMFTQKQIDEIFKEIDQDNSGTVDFSEVLVVGFQYASLLYVYQLLAMVFLFFLCPPWLFWCVLIILAMPTSSSFPKGGHSAT